MSSIRLQNQNSVQLPTVSNIRLLQTGKVSLRTRPMSSFMSLWLHLILPSRLFLVWTEYSDYLLTRRAVLCQSLLYKGTDFFPGKWIFLTLLHFSKRCVTKCFGVKHTHKDKTVTVKKDSLDYEKKEKCKLNANHRGYNEMKTFIILLKIYSISS